MCPLAWRPSDDAHWSIDLRCGECEHEWHAVVGDRRAARFDVELNADMAVLERSLRRLELQRMSAEVEAFAAALECDLIGPADFDR